MLTLQEKVKVKERYKEAYAVSNTIINFARLVFLLFVLIGIICAVGGIMGIADPAANKSVAWTLIVSAVVFIIVGVIFRTLVAAYAQLLRATLDVAVNTEVIVLDNAKKETASLANLQIVQKKQIAPSLQVKAL